MAVYVQRAHTKGQIDRAGEALVPWWTGNPPRAEISEAYTIVENWRSCHAYPLNSFQITLRARAHKVEPDALIARRLKRFVSMMNKLTREPNMKLSQMQDLGGCRAIMSSVTAVRDLHDLYRGPADLFSAELKCDDYISSPKPDGYRGIHIVGRFAARVEAREPWNGQRIEIQLRTKLQHAFATTVETVTTFTRMPLKFGGGPDDWKRFFSLMGSVLAIREQTPRVLGTPDDDAELIRELREAANALRVKQRLRGWARALKRLPRRHIKGAKWLLLVLDLNANTLSVVGFGDAKKAVERLRQIEQKPGIRGDLDAVLVSVQSTQHLRAAYPNYYADAAAFLNALDQALRV